MDRSDLLHGQDTTTTSVGRYCDQGARTDLICSMDKTPPPPQLAGIVIRVHGPICSIDKTPPPLITISHLYIRWASNIDPLQEQTFPESFLELNPPSALFLTRSNLPYAVPYPKSSGNLPPPPCQSLGKYRSLRSIQHNSNIVVTRSDKGSQTVILDTVDYTSKMTEILSDHTTFIPVTQSDVSTSVKTFRLKLLRLKKSGNITPDQYSSFISDLNSVPYIYGLPKTHKPGIPLRPIIAYHLSPAYKLSKYLAGYLTPLVKTRPQSFAITDIPSFIQSVQSLSPALNSAMVSFDVNSMYLSLPHQLIINQLTKFLQDNHTDSQTIDSIIALSSLCLDFTTFTFNNLFYKQIRGSPMGSPLSSPLAEIVMSTIDHWIQQQFTPGIHMWRRYIDDIFCICDTGQEISILACLNSFHPEVTFSLESEVNSVLPFLDILIIRTPSHYHTTVYHKINNPTFYTNFNSSCPLAHKINTVRTLTKRLVTHCFLPIFRSIELSKIIKQLALSQYPPHFIHKYRYNPLSVKPTTVSRNICLLPFSPQSVSISRILRSHGVNTYFSNNKSIDTLHRSAVVQSSGGSVYSVSCNDCNASYIGETGRSVATRMTEHGSNVRDPNGWRSATPLKMATIVYKLPA
ncbi:hypothetical protein LAZ67_9003493 [Cordylochernes scorpioides]|uniref:Reverse transcriptase domain-containing protein n=1 Tax=Cordylochernes scorpioides TaxID=51811 RepID=A0ABY6KUI6_9ARAC|nr:hypothetical protein LAZ67_9003493 [Cordylochernes scorpioides]